jgi:hypothetical protein
MQRPPNSKQNSFSALPGKQLQRFPDLRETLYFFPRKGFKF